MFLYNVVSGLVFLNTKNNNTKKLNLKTYKSFCFVLLYHREMLRMKRQNNLLKKMVSFEKYEDNMLHDETIIVIHIFPGLLFCEASAKT